MDDDPDDSSVAAHELSDSEPTPIRTPRRNQTKLSVAPDSSVKYSGRNSRNTGSSPSRVPTGAEPVTPRKRDYRESLGDQSGATYTGSPTKRPRTKVANLFSDKCIYTFNWFSCELWGPE